MRPTGGRGLMVFRLFGALGVELEEDEPAAGAEEGAGVGSDSDMKDLLNGGLEVAGDGDGQGKGGVVLALLDGVDALPGHAQGGSELGLGEAAGLAQAAHVVIQGDNPPSGHTPHERMSCLLDMSSVLDNIRHVKPASHNSFIGCCVQEEKSDA